MADASSTGAAASGGTVNVGVDAEVIVNGGGTGILAAATSEKVSTVSNSAYITVNQGTGIYATGKLISGDATSVTNSGTIEVGGIGSKGVSIAGGASYSAEAGAGWKSRETAIAAVMHAVWIIIHTAFMR